MTRGILLDTTALLDLFQYEVGHGTPAPLLLGIAPGRRFTSVINEFEFICNQAQRTVANRMAWLAAKDIRRLRLTKEISATYENLIDWPVECHLRNDLWIAATAQYEDLAIATHDNDFADIDRLLCVAEFAPPE